MGIAVALGTIVVSVTGATDGSALAQTDGNGLEESSINRFFIDPTAGVVKVDVDITLRNVTFDTTSGDVVTQTYFHRYGLVVPTGAQNIVAVQNGRVLTGELVAGEPVEPYSTYQFDLNERLYYGETADIHLGRRVLRHRRRHGRGVRGVRLQRLAVGDPGDRRRDRVRPAA